MPDVIIEAMAQSLSVMATDVGATNILINEETGWLIPYCDEHLIEQKLIEIINTNPNVLQSKKRAAFTHIKNNFVWNIIAKRVINKIKQLIII